MGFVPGLVLRTWPGHVGTPFPCPPMDNSGSEYALAVVNPGRTHQQHDAIDAHTIEPN